MRKRRATESQAQRMESVLEALNGGRNPKE